MMRVMTTAFPTIMISGRCRFWIYARSRAVMPVPVSVAVIACHGVERKGENPDAKSGGHFKSAG